MSVLTRAVLDVHDSLHPPISTNEQLHEWKKSYWKVFRELPPAFVHVTTGGFTGGFSSEGRGQFKSLGLAMGCFHTQMYSCDPPTYACLPKPLPTETEFGSLPSAPAGSPKPRSLSSIASGDRPPRT